MEITAIYKGHSEVTEGTSQGGNAWRKAAFIFETTGDYPKQIAFTAMNATCDNFMQLMAGRLYTVLFDLSSREYNGRWYTDAKAWGFRDSNAVDATAPSLVQAQQPRQPKAVQTSMNIQSQPFSDMNFNATNDLPF